jgi:hypothetical protein
MSKGRHIRARRIRITCPVCGGVAVETKNYFACLDCLWTLGK